jgi:putative PIN family toxin of toxin-antitoxin system
VPIPRVVLDTNVLIAGLRSNSGASFKILKLIDAEKFEVCLSVSLFLEYEEVGRRSLPDLQIDEGELTEFLDYICTVAQRINVYFLWRPFLGDSDDDMILELAIAGQCDAIVTFNRSDFQGAEQIGIRILTPQELLVEIGESA